MYFTFKVFTAAYNFLRAVYGPVGGRILFSSWTEYTLTFSHFPSLGIHITLNAKRNHPSLYTDLHQTYIHCTVYYNTFLLFLLFLLLKDGLATKIFGETCKGVCFFFMQKAATV